MPSNDSAATAMRDFIDRWRNVAIGVSAHQSRNVAGKPVAWWFNTANATTEDFMRALAGDSQLVTPGKPSQSPFLTVFLKPTRPMGQSLAADRQLVEDWISAGAPLPTNVTADPSAKLEASLARRTVPFSDKTTPEELLVNEPEYFHQLINIEDYPDFLPDAQRLAERYLSEGAKETVKGSEYDPLEDFLEYEEHEFDRRMKAIYNNYLRTMYSPHWFETGQFGFRDKANVPRTYNVGRFSDAVLRERILQAAPFNLVDGAWLQNIITVGPVTKIQANLFSIWDDEAGNGVTSQNHPNVYDALLRSQNIYLPPITTREFIEQDFLLGAFTGAVFQLAVGNFPQAFFPELLGMTLYLEWEATPTLTAAVRMYARRGINPLFYRLHVAIDNVSEGHGALAKEAVKLYLEQKREEGGAKAVQEHWQRIRNGYITWATLGAFGTRFTERALVIERKQINISADPAKKECWPDFKAYYRQQMIRLIERKAPIAKDVHQGVSIGGQALSALFDDPEALLNALEKHNYVDPDRPRDSRLLKLTEFNGPMYKVFTERDKSVVLDWIESLRLTERPCYDPLPDTPAPTELPEKVAKLIADRATEAMGAHGGIMMTEPDGRSVPLSSLFERPVDLMRALITNGWIVPREEGRSMFFTRILSNGGPMDGVLNEAEKETVRAWINAGAELPSEDSKASELFVSGATPQSESAATQAPLSLRHLIGMGAVH